MKRTGERLKASREEQKLTISEVSLSTKINPRVLQAMEDGNLDKLPAVSFLRGFIRTYAIYLKLDANDLLDLFAKELAELRPAPVATAEPSSPEGTSPGTTATPEATTKARSAPPTLREPSMASRSIVAGGVVLLIVIILGVKQVVDKYEREGNVDAPPENIERLVHENDNKPAAEPATPTAAAPVAATPPPPAPNPTATPTANPTEQPEQLDAPKPLEPVKQVEPPKPVEVAKPAPAPPPPAAPPTETKAPEVKPSEVVAQPATDNPTAPDTTNETPKPPKAGTPQEVIIEALDQVEISFRIDGGRLETIVLRPEQVHTLKGATNLTIDFSDGGAINLIHNGIDKGVPGDLGKPKKIKFP